MRRHNAPAASLLLVLALLTAAAAAPRGAAAAAAAAAAPGAPPPPSQPCVGSGGTFQVVSGCVLDVGALEVGTSSKLQLLGTSSSAHGLPVVQLRGTPREGQLRGACVAACAAAAG